MTFKIERTAARGTTVLRLIGWLQRGHLHDLHGQIQSTDGAVVLDVGELTLISVEGVRFLNHCVVEGISIVNASPYISEWMARERNRTA